MGIENAIESDCACLHRLPEALFAAGISVHTMRDITRGGLATVLNELAAVSLPHRFFFFFFFFFFFLEEGAIPVHREVRELLRHPRPRPLYMGNEGKMAVLARRQEAGKALGLLRSLPEGKEAAIIGTVAEGEGVAMETAIGGRRVVDVLYGEGFARIC